MFKWSLQPLVIQYSDLIRITSCVPLDIQIFRHPGYTSLFVSLALRHRVVWVRRHNVVLPAQSTHWLTGF